MNSCLIIQTAFIGDVILSTAIPEKWHQQFPTCKIDFLVRKGNEGLLEGHPFIHRVISWDKKNKKRSLYEVIKEVRKYKYDVVINVQRFASSGLITALSKSPLKIGFKKNPFSFFFDKKISHAIDGTHEIERNQQLIASLTGNVPARPALYPTPIDVEKVKRYQGQPYICMAPASVWFTKQWSFHKWVELATALVTKGWTVYVLGASSDGRVGEEMEKINHHIINVAGKLTLLETAALMKMATMNYVNDSAPLHIASAVNAPVAAIFCSTLPSFGFGPLSDVSYIVETQEKLSCRPCGLHGKRKCPQNHFRCSEGIAIHQLPMPSK